MISKGKFIATLKRAQIYLYDDSKLKYTKFGLPLLYSLLKGEVSEEKFILEIEKQRFEKILQEYKNEQGTALEFYQQHKKLLKKDSDKQIIFLKTYQIKKIQELIKKKEYPDIFYNEELRNGILDVQNNRCFLCDRDISFIWPHLHHVDYNKINCKKENLVFLCPKCHGKTGNNRIFWTNYITEKKNG